jgi:transposase
MDDATLSSLPDDPQALKAIIVTLACQRNSAMHERDEAAKQRDRWKLKHDEKELKSQQLEVEKLRLEVELLRYKKWYYGPKADQLTTAQDVAQMLLSFSEQLEARPLELEDVPADVTLSNIEPKTIRRVKRGRRNLAAFDELPLTRKEHDLSEDQKPCPCCGKMRQRIGSESSWQIEYIPGRFERIEHIRHKYACTHCEQNGQGANIELADKPTQPIEKGLAGPGLLAFVVTSKFADYLPLYRLESIFERNGFEIDRATLSIWCRDVAQVAQPLYDLMVQRVLCSHVISTDDTVMPMLAPGNGKTKQGRMWIYIGDEDHPYNLFDFTLSRFSRLSSLVETTPH